MSSETSAIRTQTPGNYPKRNKFLYSLVHILQRSSFTGSYTRRVRKVQINHVYADRETFYAYYGNTAVDLDPLPVSHACLTEVEPALSETFLKW